MPIFDGEDIAPYPQTDRLLQRLRLGTVVVLEKCDLVHFVSGNYGRLGRRTREVKRHGGKNYITELLKEGPGK